jgi:hypothetical protein
MALDTTDLSKLALELIERLANDYEDWDEVETGVVALVVEVSGRNPDLSSEEQEEIGEDEPNFTTIEYRCSDPRRWIQAAIFARAADAALDR